MLSRKGFLLGANFWGAFCKKTSCAFPTYFAVHSQKIHNTVRTITSSPRAAVVLLETYSRQFTYRLAAKTFAFPRVFRKIFLTTGSINHVGRSLCNSIFKTETQATCLSDALVVRLGLLMLVSSCSRNGEKRLAVAAFDSSSATRV